MFAQGSQLAQVRGSASASTAYTATLRTEVTRIVVCNVTTSDATFDIYHDDDGSTYTVATALYYERTVSAKTSFVISSEAIGSGISIEQGGRLGVKTSTDLAVTFSIYGVTEDRAPR